MSESLADVPLVPLIASLLRRLEYSPSSPPFYGRIALFDEAHKPDYAKPLHHKALWHALPDQPRLAGKHTMEMEVAGWSSEGDIEFHAKVLPGKGFCRKGGLPASPDVRTAFTDFSLAGSLVVFILGFNDRDEDHWQVEQSMRDHAKSYRDEGCKVVFIEANDHHRSHLQWITEIAKKLAQEDPENILFLPTTTWNPHATQADARDQSDLMFPFPDLGWASETHAYDCWHLSQRGLLEWLPVVKDVMKRLASREGCSKVLLITDSTFQAHDYIQYECVLVQTEGGATTTFGIGKSSTVRNLKTLIAQSGFPKPGIRSEHVQLSVLGADGAFLEDDHILADCGVKDGVMLLLSIQDDSGGSAPGTPGSSPLSFFVAGSFGCEAQTIGPGVFRVPLNIDSSIGSAWTGDVGSGGYGTCYFGAGYRNGNTISEEAVRHRGNQNSSIHGSTDQEVALLYACPFEQRLPGGVRLFKAVLEGRVQAGAWYTGETMDHWHISDKHAIEIVALIVRVQGHASATAFSGPTPEQRTAGPYHAVEVTPEPPERPISPELVGEQPTNADATDGTREELPSTSSTSSASEATMAGEPMAALMTLFQDRFRSTPKFGEAERNPDVEQQFRITVSDPDGLCIQGDWARGKPEAKRVALIRLLSETSVSVPVPENQSSNLAILSERFQKKFKACPMWPNLSSSPEGTVKATLELPLGRSIEGPECGSKMEAKIAALKNALEAPE